MAEKISQDSMIDITWPVIKKYALSEDHSHIFNELSNYFKKNGAFFDDKTNGLIENLLCNISDTIRHTIFQVNLSDDNEKAFKESINFLQEFSAPLLKAFSLNNPAENQISQLKNYITDWFSRMESPFDEPNNSESMFKDKMKNVDEYIELVDKPEQILNALNELPRQNALDELSLINGDFGSGYGPIGQYVIDATLDMYHGFQDGISNIDVVWLSHFVKEIPYIQTQFDKIIKTKKTLSQIDTKLKLSEFEENPDFIKDCLELLSKLSKNDFYHGTTSPALGTIMEKGLFMVQDTMESTTYKLRRFTNFGNDEEFLKSILLFRNGFEGSRGEGIVFIKSGAEIKKLSEKEKQEVNIDYSMSGPIGVEFKIDPENIIGTIDTVKKQVEFGPALASLKSF